MLGFGIGWYLQLSFGIGKVIRHFGIGNNIQGLISELRIDI